MEAKNPIVSIIIPTLNEADFLPVLLDSIKKQTFTSYEVIVADSNSKDATPGIAKSFGCKVVGGGRPAKGRNNGADVAKGKYLLFLDSDVTLKEDFLENAISEFEKRGLGIASCYMTPLSSKIIDKIFHAVGNFTLRLNQYYDPHAPGFCILAKREIHEKIGGFNQSLRIAEDHDYAKRAKKLGKFRILKSAKIYVSVRRFYTDGRLKIMIKYIYCELYLLFRGTIKKDIYEYKFGHYKRNADAEQQVKD